MRKKPSSAEAAEPVDSAAGRALRLLGVAAAESRPIGLAELAVRLGLPKATTHRLCEQLLAAGFLTRDLDAKAFIAGPALQRLAFDTLNHGSLRGLRHQVLVELVTQVGETCNFTTLDGASVLYLDRVEAVWPLRLTLDVGSHVPLHCTASGKLFLAHLPAAAREELISHLPLTRTTPQTITAAKALRAECERIAAAGYSCDREEFITGLIAVAVPLRDAEGTVRAAVAMHAPVARMNMKAAEARLPALRAAAKRMAALL